MTPIEINQAGYKALMDALGFDGMMYFLRQFNANRGDYTTEREQYIGNLTLEDIFNEIERNSSKPISL